MYGQMSSYSLVELSGLYKKFMSNSMLFSHSWSVETYWLLHQTPHQQNVNAVCLYTYVMYNDIWMVNVSYFLFHIGKFIYIWLSCITHLSLCIFKRYTPYCNVILTKIVSLVRECKHWSFAISINNHGNHKQLLMFFINKTSGWSQFVL